MYGLQYPWSTRAMDKGKIEAMVTKFSEKFAIIMLKKHRKFCRSGLTDFDATPIFKKSYIWATLYIKISSQKINVIFYIKSWLWKQSLFLSKDPSLFEFTNYNNCVALRQLNWHY